MYFRLFFTVTGLCTSPICTVCCSNFFRSVLGFSRAVTRLSASPKCRLQLPRCCSLLHAVTGLSPKHRCALYVALMGDILGVLIYSDADFVTCSANPQHCRAGPSYLYPYRNPARALRAISCRVRDATTRVKIGFHQPKDRTLVVTLHG